MATVLLVNPNTSAHSTALMLPVARPLLPGHLDLRGATAEAPP